jgi:hypothetical protein
VRLVCRVLWQRRLGVDNYIGLTADRVWWIDFSVCSMKLGLRIGSRVYIFFFSIVTAHALSFVLFRSLYLILDVFILNEPIRVTTLIRNESQGRS